MPSVNVSLSSKLLYSIDEEAKRTGKCRSEILERRAGGNPETGIRLVS